MTLYMRQTACIVVNGCVPKIIQDTVSSYVLFYKRFGCFRLYRHCLASQFVILECTCVFQGWSTSLQTSLQQVTTKLSSSTDMDKV